jgi:hypothetical protein
MINSHFMLKRAIRLSLKLPELHPSAAASELVFDSCGLPKQLALAGAGVGGGSGPVVARRVGASVVSAIGDPARARKSLGVNSCDLLSESLKEKGFLVSVAQRDRSFEEFETKKEKKILILPLSTCFFKGMRNDEVVSEYEVVSSYFKSSFGILLPGFRTNCCRVLVVNDLFGELSPQADAVRVRFESNISVAGGEVLYLADFEPSSVSQLYAELEEAW